MATISHSKYSNIARPYAQAAFEFAHQAQQIKAWKVFLESAAIMVNNPLTQTLLANPEVPASKAYQFFHDVLGSVMNKEQTNFLLLLAQNKRLQILPDIQALFEMYYSGLEKISNVRVITAIEIDDQYRKKLAQAITKRIQHQVTLTCDVDPSILGGAIIQLGDKVIDGSVRGKLARLLDFSLRG